MCWCVQAIEEIPNQDSPELFGLHPNADLTFRTLQVHLPTLSSSEYIQWTEIRVLVIYVGREREGETTEQKSQGVGAASLDHKCHSLLNSGTPVGLL